MTDIDRREPTPLFQILRETAVSKFKSQEVYMNEHQRHVPYTLFEAVRDTIDQITRDKPPVEVYSVLVDESGIEKDQVVNLVSGVAEAENWDAMHKELSRLILFNVMRRDFPEIVKEEDRRFDLPIVHVS